MELNMEMAGTGSALRNKFEDKFMIENDVVGGLDGSKGTYIVPAAKSTDVESINKPLLGYLFAVAKEHGATIGSSITTDYPAPTGEKLA
ncbi:MAG: hypothetical protein KAH32_00510 [Chlamydiia bacterium]|nr:hypothetical protein [Chlamydiia bacterium]